MATATAAENPSVDTKTDSKIKADWVESYVFSKWENSKAKEKADGIHVVKMAALNPTTLIQHLTQKGLTGGAPEPFADVMARIGQPNWRGLSDDVRVAVAIVFSETAADTIQKAQLDYSIHKAMIDAIAASQSPHPEPVNCAHAKAISELEQENVRLKENLARKNQLLKKLEDFTLTALDSMKELASLEASPSAMTTVDEIVRRMQLTIQLRSY